MGEPSYLMLMEKVQSIFYVVCKSLYLTETHGSTWLGTYCGGCRCLFQVD